MLWSSADDREKFSMLGWICLALSLPTECPASAMRMFYGRYSVFLCVHLVPCVTWLIIRSSGCHLEIVVSQSAWWKDRLLERWRSGHCWFLSLVILLSPAQTVVAVSFIIRRSCSLYSKFHPPLWVKGQILAKPDSNLGMRTSREVNFQGSHSNINRYTVVQVVCWSSHLRVIWIKWPPEWHLCILPLAYSLSWPVSLCLWQ